VHFKVFFAKFSIRLPKVIRKIWYRAMTTSRAALCCHSKKQTNKQKNTSVLLYVEIYGLWICRFIL